MPATTHKTEPLSDEEYNRLDELLDGISPLDVEGLHGLLHAIAVAPSALPMSVWLTAVAPGGLAELGREDLEEFASLLVRLHMEVIDGVSQHLLSLPAPDDIEACESFAAGYTAGAELDPEWVGDEDRWTFASSFAYLAGRLDLVSAATVESIERNWAPDPKELIRRSLGTLIVTTEECFKKYREPSVAASPPARSKARPGRNEPCPCGSGKKHKRCCIDAEQNSPAN